MKKAMLATILITMSTFEAFAAMPSTLTVEKLLDICESATVAEAETKGDVLGWPRMTDEQTRSWRLSFLRYNGGTVSLVGWKRPQQTGEDLLSFWIATGPNAHKACTYTSANPAGLLDALSKQLGAPESLDRTTISSTAFWKQGQREVAFTQVGTASALVNVSYKN